MLRKIKEAITKLKYPHYTPMPKKIGSEFSEAKEIDIELCPDEVRKALKEET